MLKLHLPQIIIIVNNHSHYSLYMNSIIIVVRFLVHHVIDTQPCERCEEIYKLNVSMPFIF